MVDHRCGWSILFFQWWCACIDLGCPVAWCTTQSHGVSLLAAMDSWRRPGNGSISLFITLPRHISSWGIHVTKKHLQQLDGSYIFETTHPSSVTCSSHIQKANSHPPLDMMSSKFFPPWLDINKGARDGFYNCVLLMCLNSSRRWWEHLQEMHGNHQTID